MIISLFSKFAYVLMFLCRQTAMSFGADIPPFEELEPLLAQIERRGASVEQQRAALDGLAKFLAGDMLASQYWPMVWHADDIWKWVNSCTPVFLTMSV